jgi:hypothetical protein
LVLIGILLLAACGKQGIVDPTPPTGSQPPPPPPGNHPPSAVIGAPPSDIGPEGSPIPFDAAQSSDPDRDSVRFLWTFGDGAARDTSRTVLHTYRNNGSYPVTLIVTDSHGLADTASLLFTVANVEPQITLLRYPDTVLAGTTIGIEVEYFDPGVDDTTQVWLWISHAGGAGGRLLSGPGTVLTTLTDTGSYSIEVAAEDNDGAMVDHPGDRPLIVVPRPAPTALAVLPSRRMAAP